MEATTSMAATQGPTWDNSQEYTSLDSAEFQADLNEIIALTEKIKAISGTLANLQGDALVRSLQDSSAVFDRAYIVGYNLMTFVNCELSVDSKNDRAQKLLSIVQQKMNDFMTAFTPVDLFITLCSDEIFEKYLKAPHTESERFSWEQKRRTRHWALSEKEEVTLSQFRQHGLTAWGDLYDQISGIVSVDMPSKGKVGLAEASGYLRSANEAVRREAWQGIQNAWGPHQEAVAGILNSLAGWRHEEYRKRSHKVPVHYLDRPLVDARIERATLDAMMSAIQQKIEVPRRGLRAMARCLGKTKIDPWDLLSPSPRAPKDMKIEYTQAIAMIRKTFADFDPKGGAEFIDMMVKNNWIEGRVLPNKRQGAYCTSFAKSKTPRVFQTFYGFS